MPQATPYANIGREAVANLVRKLEAEYGRAYAPIDLSSLEARIMKRLLTEPYGAPPENGVDIHTATAADAFGVPASEVTSEQRTWAKHRNYFRMYGWRPPLAQT